MYMHTVKMSLLHRELVIIGILFSLILASYACEGNFVAFIYYIILFTDCIIIIDLNELKM